MTEIVHWRAPERAELPSGPGLSRRRRGALLAGCALSGAWFVAAFQAAAIGLAAASWLTVNAALVGAFAGPVRRRVALPLAASVFFAGWVVVRASWWLVPLDLAAAGGLLLVAASSAGQRRVWSRSVGGWLLAIGQAVVAGFEAPAVLVRSVLAVLPARRGGVPWRAVGRGLLVAVPLLVVLGALLASADAVFASFLSLRFDLGRWTDRAVLFGMGLVGAAALVGPLGAAGDASIEDRAAASRRVGPVESGVVLIGMVVLFGLFAASQLAAAIGGDRYVQRRAGLSYAGYARQGFFQLLAVAALTVAVLGLVRSLTRTDRAGLPPVLRLLGIVVVALSEVIVVAATHRIGLYRQAYGQTMLRAYTSWFAWWLGVVFALLGAAWGGLWAHRRWLSIALWSSAGLWLAAVNVVDPEARVARADLGGARPDVGYVVTLTDDAFDAMADALTGDELSDADRRALTRRLCDADGRASAADGGWTAFNLARARAEQRRRQVCSDS